MFIKIIYIHPTLSVETVKKKWKNLRDSYAKYIRSLKTTTGQSAKRYKHWQWAPHMEVFKPFLQFSKTVSNVRCDVVEINEINNIDDVENSQLCPPDAYETVQDSGDFAEIPTSIPQTRKRSTATLNSTYNIQNTTPSALDKVIGHLENKRGRYDYDATDLLMLSYSKTIKSFSLERQAQTKFEIAQILMQQEINHIREQQEELISKDEAPTHSPITLDSSSLTDSITVELVDPPLLRNNSFGSFLSGYANN